VGSVVDDDLNSLLETVLRQKSASQQNLQKIGLRTKVGTRLAAAQLLTEQYTDDAACTFTWKRSRKAEAAARNPACGYDFNDEQTHCLTQGGEGISLKRIAADVNRHVSKEKRRFVSTQTVDRAACVPHIDASHSPLRALSTGDMNSNKIASRFCSGCSSA
jgi:hypothetical protein